jgi:hypothetical protein
MRKKKEAEEVSSQSENTFQKPAKNISKSKKAKK